MFRPDNLLVTGEIQVTLSNGHVVPARIEMNEVGGVQLQFVDADIVGRWLKIAIDNNLVGLQIVSLSTRPFEES